MEEQRKQQPTPESDVCHAVMLVMMSCMMSRPPHRFAKADSLVFDPPAHSRYGAPSPPPSTGSTATDQPATRKAHCTRNTAKLLLLYRAVTAASLSLLSVFHCGLSFPRVGDRSMAAAAGEEAKAGGSSNASNTSGEPFRSANIHNRDLQLKLL